MKTSITLLATVLFLAAGDRARAQTTSPFEIFLKIDITADSSVQGSSTVPGHAGEIDVLSFKAGVMQRALTNVAGGGATASKSDFKPLTVYKNIDLATPALLVDCALGKPFPSATLTVLQIVNNVPRPFFQIDLTDVYIGSVNEDSDTTDQTGALVETVSLSYSKIKWTYTPVNSDGGQGTPETFGFDLKANKKL